MNTLQRNTKALPVWMSCLSIAAVIALPSSASAQEWRIEPIVRVGGEYDDNATLNIRTDQEVELSGLLLDGRVDVKYASERTEFNFAPRITAREYDKSQYSSDDWFVKSNLKHVGTFGAFGFLTDYGHQTVRTAERATSDIDIDNPDEITDDDTGRVILEGTRNKLRFSPYFEKRLSNISTLNIKMDYFDVGYDDVLAGTLFDYDDTRLSLQYARGLSDVNTAMVAVTGRNFDSSAGGDKDVTGYGLLVGMGHDFSEQTNFTAMIGFEETNQSGSDIDPNVVGNLTLIRRLETIRMFVRYKRSVNATGAGRLSVRDALNLGFRRRLSETITAGLGIRAYQTGPVSGGQDFDDREYVQLQSNFQFYLTSSFVVDLSYRYTVSDRSAAVGERANSNQLNIWFTYQPRTVPRL